MRKIYLVILTIIPVFFIEACTSSPKIQAVSTALENRTKYLEKEISVFGDLLLSDEKLAICDPGSSDLCINIELSLSNYEKAKRFSAELVVINGTYVSHEYKRNDIDGEELFYPSRIIVSSLKKWSDRSE